MSLHVLIHTPIDSPLVDNLTGHVLTFPDRETAVGWTRLHDCESYYRPTALMKVDRAVVRDCRRLMVGEET
jgi:hypothetical protein